MNNLGARVYGLAAMLMGITGLVWGDFATGWDPVPATLPGRMVLAYAVGALLAAGGVLINVRRTAVWGAALLTVVSAAGLVLADLTRLAMHLLQYAYWVPTAEQLGVVAGGAIALAALAKIDPQRSARLQLAGRIVFGVCLFSFGAAHFVYFNLTWPLVPKWLPPDQAFWAYATGVAHIAAGVAILSDVFALLAARLLTLMYVLFGILVHAPLVMAAPADHGRWTENALNLALVGAAWIVADSLAARERDKTQSGVIPGRALR